MSGAEHKLALYVAGDTERSKGLVRAIDAFLGNRLHLSYELRVIDVLREPEAAEADSIIMTPTLVVKVPEPERRLFGDVLDAEKLMLVLHVDGPDNKT